MELEIEGICLDCYGTAACTLAGLRRELQRLGLDVCTADERDVLDRYAAAYIDPGQRLRPPKVEEWDADKAWFDDRERLVQEQE